jgi:hypothetical protein
MKTIHILGTAPSVQDYKPDGSETIGVNDIFRFHEVDNLLILDKRISFLYERLQIITESTPKRFYSDLTEWREFFPEMIKIETTGDGNQGKVYELDSNKYIYHCDSTFTAVHLAYKHGAKNIIMYGVDFTGDRWQNKKIPILRTYSNLYIALRNRGEILSIANPESLLTQVLPLI